MNLKWRLSHVRGYLELGMVREAHAELEAIEGEDARLPEVLALRVGLLQAEQKWKPLRKLAGQLATENPDDASWWIIWAFATRRALSVQSALKILLNSEVRHPTDPTIQFNIGCYYCLLGDLESARIRVTGAIRADSSFLKNAIEDPDLQALRDSDPEWLNK